MRAPTGISKGKHWNEPSRRELLVAAAAGIGVGAMAMGARAHSDTLFIPPEWGKHQFTLMQWPVNREIYPEADFLASLQGEIAKLANSISEFEPVKMLAAKEHHANMRPQLSEAVELWDIPTDDLWARDSGPIFGFDTHDFLVAASIGFNAWGNKQPHEQDRDVTRRVAKHMDIEFVWPNFVGEAGGVEHNGRRTLLAHESSWVNPNRNKMSKAKLARQLNKFYGTKKIIWAPGLKGEDITDYHIDALARFVAPDEVVIQLPRRDPEDVWARAAYETYFVLLNATTASGDPIKLHVIDEPENIRAKADDFVASYVNYTLVNGAVIMSEFGDEEADAKAREILAGLFADREIVALNMDLLAEVGGGIHCATKECPEELNEAGMSGADSHD